MTDPIKALLAVKASDLLNQNAGYIERRLLEGANRIVVEIDIAHPSWQEVWAANGTAGGTLSHVIYEIPRWRDHPRNRLRIWLARRQFRRSLA